MVTLHTRTAGSLAPSIKYLMRILVTLPQDSPELVEIALYCQRHGINLTRQCWHLDSRDYEFYLILAEAQDQPYITWLYIAYPNRFFSF